jgi:hypothetical protein
MKISARLLEMASDEVLTHIPSRVLADIRRADPHPTFRAYVVGHEGESKGKVMVDGEKVSVLKRWYKKTIDVLHDKITYGLQLFHGHNYDNSQDQRVPIGEVVGKTMQKIKDVWSSIVITYIRPEFRNLPLDVASIEADINLTREGGELVVDLHDVHAIALGNSATEVPGFAGATLLTQVQEFAEIKEQYTLKKVKVDEMEITIDEIKNIIKAENIAPGDLYTFGALSEDSSVKELVKTESKKAGMGEYKHRERTDKAFDKAREDWDKEKADLQNIINALKPIATKTQRNDLFSKIKETRKLEEREIKFIEKKLDGFVPDKPEDLEKELNTFVDGQLDDFKAYAEIYGVEVKKAAAADGGDDKDPALGAGKDTTGSDNPFID